jgi:putative redox protein
VSAHAVHVTFPGHAGLKLAGILQPAAGLQRGTVLLLHCFTCSKEYKILSWLARELAIRGYRSLRFDFAGLGESQGDFSGTTLSTDVDDVLAAARWLTRGGSGPLTFIGHSLGGAAAILAAEQLPDVRTVVALATSVDAGRRISEKLRQTGSGRLEIAGKTYPVSDRRLRDLEELSLQEKISGWDRALLVMAGTADRIVPLAEVERLFAAARAPKAFVAVPDADHLFAGRRSQAPRLAAIIDAWIQLNGGDTK